MPRSGKQIKAHVDLSVLPDLVNTRPTASRSEQFDTPAATSHWLTSHRLLPAETEVTEQEHQQLLALRETLAEVLFIPKGHWSLDTATRLNSILRGKHLEMSFDAEGLVRVDSAARTFDELLSKILNLVIIAHFTDQWIRLKVCVNSQCQVAFYDDDRTNRRRWCTRRCSDVVRSRAFRRSRRFTR